MCLGVFPSAVSSNHWVARDLFFVFYFITFEFPLAHTEAKTQIQKKRKTLKCFRCVLSV